MAHDTPASLAVAQDDLDVVTHVAMMRLPLRAAETHRLELMRMLLEAEADLSRALAAHTHCALVNFRGSHGTSDLGGEARLLWEALERYTELVADVAAEYRLAVRHPIPPLELLPASPDQPRLGVG
jgi:hypothetical protein